MEYEIITLVLQDNRFEVDKTKLINKSHYFECLFSPHFYNTPKKEHIINYNIDLFTFQNFIEWIQDDTEISMECSYFVKSSMLKYKTENIKDLLNLLELAVLFLVDNLINDITDIIVLYWLKSNNVIDIWLLAKDLAVQPLSDICLSVCLDRFMDLPINVLIELSINNFKELIQNNNIRSTQKYLHYVLQEWTNNNKDSTINNIQINIAGTRRIEWVQYVIGYEIENYGYKKEYICCWNDNQFSKLVELKYLKVCGRDLVGQQITGRGFSIYLAGGEFGLGTGQFNETIWRYCLIAKKWYYFARLPYPRRHMVLGFIGQWKRTTNIPEWFTEVPPHTFVNKKLLLLQTSLNIFDSELESWKIVTLNNIIMPPRYRSSLIVYGIVIFIINNNEIVLHKISNVQEKICDDCLQLYKDHTMVHTMSDEYLLEEEFIPDIGVLSILSKVCESCNYSYLQRDDEIKNDSLGLTLTPRVGSFCTINPSTLHCIST
ncbi:PREDICTED: uncharacterized protein LOC106788675 isoform X2 [Polistes canadensis]|uniref:uncharacterized protein LOC106788675 isoform X2 n=1 Tax=Polistes canadensis TaxID=91411 RepID=UPI000718CFBD|nr:PREDICTED: uncharacterized protein LOC106788675 isoform X2 [Polistes canadensis]